MHENRDENDDGERYPDQPEKSASTEAHDNLLRAVIVKETFRYERSLLLTSPYLYPIISCRYHRGRPSRCPARRRLRGFRRLHGSGLYCDGYSDGDGALPGASGWLGP